MTPYTDFGGAKTTALTQDELNAEAERIVSTYNDGAVQDNRALSPEARAFFLRKRGEFHARKRLIGITVKQLWWLRDIAANLD